MIYDTEYMDSNFNELIKTDTYIKVFLSSKHEPVYKNDKLIACIKNDNDISIFDSDEYLDNNNYYFNNFETVRLNIISEPTFNRVKSLIKDKKIKNTINYKQCFVHLIKKIDSNVLEFNGKENRVERWVRNHYDKSKFEVLSEYKNINDVIDLLNFWAKRKKENGTVMVFHGYDKNYYNKYYIEDKIRLGDNFLSLYWYDKNKLIAQQTMEKTATDFWSIHIRKTDRFTYPNLNLYVDIFSYRQILEKTGKPFYVNIGYEGGKMCDYKLKRFPTHSMFKSYNLKFEPRQTIKTFINL